MPIMAPWNDRLAEPLSNEHLVHLYDDDRILVDAVALYAGHGLGKGEAVVLVATAEHLEAIEERLAAAGFEPGDLKAWGQLMTLDAARLLSRFLIDGEIDAGVFEGTLASVIAGARCRGRFPRVRVYGEMVNLLWRDNHPATRRLEELWNAAIQTHSVSLLCGYRLEGGEERAIPDDLQALHSHLIPLHAGA
jgi:hypothetical protein